jgi:hypothetical protein
MKPIFQILNKEQRKEKLDYTTYKNLANMRGYYNIQHEE